MRYILLMFFMLSIWMSTFAQRPDQRREKLESKKIAFISDRLDLSPAEAQVFWPVYNEYDYEMKALKSKKEAMHKRDEAIDEEQAKSMLKQSLEFEEGILNIKKSYVDKFSTKIGPLKTLEFFRMERRFKEKLLRSFKEGKEKRKEMQKGNWDK